MPVEKEVEVVLKFPETENLSPPIMQLDELSFWYGPDRVIFNNVNLGATMESRICIVSSRFVRKNKANHKILEYRLVTTELEKQLSSRSSWAIWLQPRVTEMCIVISNLATSVSIT
jgi:ATPase subunit of ABC transporter with duplicated ATPase domains